MVAPQCRHGDGRGPVRVSAETRGHRRGLLGFRLHNFCAPGHDEGERTVGTLAV
jgi:hypothetical protein